MPGKQPVSLKDHLDKLRAGLAPTPTHTGYMVRPMSDAAKLARAALYNMYFQGEQATDDRGFNEIEIHNYMKEQIGTFLPLELGEALQFLARTGEARVESFHDGERRYRLTTEGSEQEESARRGYWPRQWDKFRSEFGERIAWLVIGVAISLLTLFSQRLLFPPPTP